ncbi:MAG: helix-turn-helix transcriptional regulator, partial [Bacteroidales bacterium]|nr:helix-turn-helix transcriptional regulator [Bacteroidales bacterium]
PPKRLQKVYGIFVTTNKIWSFFTKFDLKTLQLNPMHNHNNPWKHNFECDIIKGIRLALNMSQRKLIELTSVDVSKYESHKSTPTINSLKKLCTGFNISLGGLFLMVDELEQGRRTVPQAVNILIEWEVNERFLSLAMEQMRS